MTEQEKKTKPGPEEEHLKIDGDWKDAMKKSLEKERPEGGWPTMLYDCPKCGERRPHIARPIVTADDGTRIQTMVCGVCGHEWPKPL